MTEPTEDRRGRRAALVIAHPGHELRVHGWLERVQPDVLVLTRGDGRHGESRLLSTSRVLRATGATPGPVYGRLADREVYAAILRSDRAKFLDLLGEVVRALVLADVDCVVADAEEGYNPSHDVCHYLAVAAAAAASVILRRTIEVFDFLLVGPPAECPLALRSQARWQHLDDAALARKLAAAAGYPEMKEEVERALVTHGGEAFRVECLRPAARDTPFRQERPFYEAHGERRVADGTYPCAIRFRPHLESLRATLFERAGLGAGA
jgi:LmbE family N-acetylglucosaminyl deacetylase